MALLLVLLLKHCNCNLNEYQEVFDKGLQSHPIGIFGIVSLEKCQFDFNDLILATICQNPEEAYDMEFFKKYGYKAIPKSNQIYITDAIELLHSDQ